MKKNNHTVLELSSRRYVSGTVRMIIFMIQYIPHVYSTQHHIYYMCGMWHIIYIIYIN